MITTAGILSLLCCTLSLAANMGRDGDVFRLLVLHTNDMHSRFDQIDSMGAQCVQIAGESQPACYGGFARLKTAVEEARAASVDATLFLNAGDTFQGTSFYTYFRWPIVARMVQPLGIDVMVSEQPDKNRMSLGLTRR